MAPTLLQMPIISSMSLNFNPVWLQSKFPMSFPCSSAGKESTCNVGDLGSIPGLGRSPEEGKGYPLQYSGLENSMDFIVHGVAKNQTRLSDFHFHFPRVMKLKAETNKWDLIKPKSFCTAKETRKQNEKTTLRMGKNICK